VNKKKFRKQSLTDESAATEDLAYWLSKTPEERIAEVQRLRRQVHGNKATPPCNALFGLSGDLHVE